MKEIPEYKTIIYSQEGKRAVVTLHQPDNQNYLDNNMIHELYDIFSKLENDDETGCIVLTGTGKTFCLGYDLKQLIDADGDTYRDSLNRGLLFAKLLYLIYAHPKPVIAKVNGDAVSEGVGLFSVCDIVIADETSKFCFNYVKMGLVPAIIAPYLVRKIGESFTREYFITGEQISADKSSKIGLINHVTSKDNLDKLVDEKANYLLSNDKKAIASIKEILGHISLMRHDELLKYTPAVDTEIRTSDNAIEGTKAFIENRKPSWQ
jgi:methylglutaconyl-CoA hydratase